MKIEHHAALGLLLLFILLPVLLSADDLNNREAGKTVVVYSHHTFTRSIGLEPFVEIGVGALAFILFVISALAWWRDRRNKFLVVCLAFLVFTLKGLFGVLDLFYPADTSFLMAFSDLLDFAILFLLVMAVVKD